MAAGVFDLKMAGVKATNLKKLESVRRAFVFGVEGINSWQEAKQKYPEHTTDKALSKFLKDFGTTFSKLLILIICFY